MKKIKIIGSGRVVRSLLSDYSDALNGFDFEIYSRKPRSLNNAINFKGIKSFVPSNDIVLLCTSVGEGCLLKKHNSKSRSFVLEENIKLVDEYIKLNYFNKGQVFVLTNPSELIAEYIFRKTSNTQVFALGQEVDIKRYQKVLSLNRRVKCLGQHFQYPIIPKEEIDFNQLMLREKLIKEIQEEFIDDYPPFESGVYNIIQLLQSLRTNGTTMVSSYSSRNDSFLCGSLKIRNNIFKINKPSTINEKNFIDEQVDISRNMLKRYLV